MPPPAHSDCRSCARHLKLSSLHGDIPQGFPRLSVDGPWLPDQDRNPVFLPWKLLIGHLCAENPNTKDGAMKRDGLYRSSWLVAVCWEKRDYCDPRSSRLNEAALMVERKWQFKTKFRAKAF